MEDTDLKISDLKKNEVILDSSFKEDEGIQVGDQVIDKTSKQKLKVVAFAKNAKYGYSEIGFISSDTYTGMRQKTDPSYQWQAQTLVTKKSIPSSDLASNLMVADKKQVIDKIPGYKAQNLTLRIDYVGALTRFFCYPWGLLLHPHPAEVETVRCLEGYWHVHEPDYLCPTIPAHHHLPHRSAIGAWLGNYDGSIFTE